MGGDRGVWLLTGLLLAVEAAVAPDGSCSIFSLFSFSVPDSNDTATIERWDNISSLKFGIDATAAALLAMDHFNNRDPSIVVELAALTTDCNVTLTELQVADNQWDIDTSVRETIKEVMRPKTADRDTPCAVLGPADEEPAEGTAAVTSALGVPQMVFSTASRKLLSVESPTTVGTALTVDGQAEALCATLATRGIDYMYIVSNPSPEADDLSRAIQQVCRGRSQVFVSILDKFWKDERFNKTEWRIRTESELHRVKESGVKTIFLNVGVTDTVVELAIMLDELDMFENSFVYILSAEAFPTDRLSALMGIRASDDLMDKLLRGAMIFDRLDGFRYRNEDPFYEAWRKLDADFVARVNAILPATVAKVPDLYFQNNFPSNSVSYIFDAVMTIGFGGCNQQSEGNYLSVSDGDSVFVPPSQDSGGSSGGYQPPPNGGDGSGGYRPPQNGGYQPPPSGSDGSGGYPPPQDGGENNSSGGYQPPQDGGYPPPPDRGDGSGGMPPPMNGTNGSGGCNFPPNGGNGSGNFQPPMGGSTSSGGCQPPPNGSNGQGAAGQPPNGGFGPPFDGSGPPPDGSGPPPNGGQGGSGPPPGQGSGPPPNGGSGGGGGDGSGPPPDGGLGGGGNDSGPPPDGGSGGGGNGPGPPPDGGSGEPPPGSRPPSGSGPPQAGPPPGSRPPSGSGPPQAGPPPGSRPPSGSGPPQAGPPPGSRPPSGSGPPQAGPPPGSRPPTGSGPPQAGPPPGSRPPSGSGPPQARPPTGSRQPSGSGPPQAGPPTGSRPPSGSFSPTGSRPPNASMPPSGSGPPDASLPPNVSRPTSTFSGPPQTGPPGGSSPPQAGPPTGEPPGPPGPPIEGPSGPPIEGTPGSPTGEPPGPPGPPTEAPPKPTGSPTRLPTRPPTTPPTQPPIAAPVEGPAGPAPTGGGGPGGPGPPPTGSGGPGGPGPPPTGGGGPGAPGPPPTGDGGPGGPGPPPTGSGGPGGPPPGGPPGAGVNGGPSIPSTGAPTAKPTRVPTQRPTREPTEKPTRDPTERPTKEPTERPTREPTERPTREPTERPTKEPTERPTEEPTRDESDGDKKRKLQYSGAPEGTYGEGGSAQMGLARPPPLAPPVFLTGLSDLDPLVVAMAGVSFQGASGRVNFLNGEKARDPSDVAVGLYNVRATLAGEGLHTYEARLTSLWINGTWLGDESFIYRDGSTVAPLLTREISESNYLAPWVRGIGFALMTIAWVLGFGCFTGLVLLRQDNLIQRAQPFFMMLLCGGAVITSCAILTLSFDEGYNWTDQMLDAACMATPWFFFLGQIVTFSALFTKLWRLDKVLQFRHGNKVRIRKVIAPLLALLTTSLLILTVWTIVDPWTWERVVINESPAEDYGQCVNDHFWAFFGPLMALLILAEGLTAFFAWKTNDVPEDFRDSSAVIYAILIQLQAWVIGVPILSVLNNSSAEATYFGRVLLIWIFSISSVCMLVVPMIVKAVRLRRNPGLQTTRARVSVSGLTAPKISLSPSSYGTTSTGSDPRATSMAQSSHGFGSSDLGEVKEEEPEVS